MRGRDILWKLCCIIFCLDEVTGSVFLAPLITRLQNITHRVTLLSEKPEQVNVLQPGTRSLTAYNVIYSRPLRMNLQPSSVNVDRNYTGSYMVMELTSDGDTVAFLSSEGTNDLSVTSLIPMNGDSNYFVIPYFVPNMQGAALVVSGVNKFFLDLDDHRSRVKRKNYGAHVTVRTVPRQDITGFHLRTGRSTAVYIDIPCLVSPHHQNVCGTAHVPVPPITRLGYDYVIPRPPGRHFNVVYRVVAALTHTHVLVWDQTNSWKQVASLRIGEFYDGVSTSGSGSVSIQCGEPCAVTQILATNTSYNFKALEVVPDLTKSQRRVIFELDTLPAGDVHYITVLTLEIQQRSLLLNGIPLGGARWTVLSSWPEWSLTSFPVPEGNHNISSIDGTAPILAWHYAVLNGEVLTLGSITGYGCQDHLCIRRGENGECVSCKEGLILNSGKCQGPEISAGAGDNITLPCFYKASQTTNVIKWYKQRDTSVCGYESQDSRKIIASISSTGVKSVTQLLGTRVDLETSSGDLEIGDVTIQDEGFYTCHSFGSIMSRVEVKLSVFVYPSEMFTSWSVIGDKDNFKFKITCQVMRVRPQPSEFFWVLPDNVHAGESSFTDNKDGTIEATLTYTLEVTPSVKTAKCIIKVADRHFMEQLPFDDGLRLLLSAHADRKDATSKQLNSTDHPHVVQIGTIIGAVIGGLVILLLIAIVMCITFCARRMVKSPRPHSSPIPETMGCYCLRQCGCPHNGRDRADSVVTTCTPLPGAGNPRPSTCSEMGVSNSRRDLLVSIDNVYDSCCSLRNNESIATETTTT